MTADQKKTLSGEQLREYLKRQQNAYEQMEAERLQQPWREPTAEEKLAFDRLMADVNRTPGPSRPCGMVEWYRALSRAKR